MNLGATGYDQHALHPAGPQAAAIGALWWFYLALLTAVAVLVIGSVLLAIWRRRTRQVTPELPALALGALPERKTHHPLRELAAEPEKKRLRAVVGSTAATVIALFVLLAESISASNALESLEARDALEIQVTGKQWWWQVRYLDTDPSRAFVTANEIHLPVGRSVRFTLSSADVIHSFWVPNLHGKRDLIPGRDSSLVLRADRPGRYRSQCAEFCGHAHAQMALWVVVEPKAQFEAWAARQRAAAPQPATELARAGQDVFMRNPCVMCHAIAGTSAQSNVGPDLTHVATRLSLAAGTYPNRRGQLAGWLLEAQGMKPGNHMPNISLPAPELHALIAYLETLR
jgi:cytochrome c oxidase subunit 2